MLRSRVRRRPKALYVRLRQTDFLPEHQVFPAPQVLQRRRRADDRRQAPEIFDRDWEWSQLDRFVSDARPGATLGIVSGRRGQGKIFGAQPTNGRLT